MAWFWTRAHRALARFDGMQLLRRCAALALVAALLPAFGTPALAQMGTGSVVGTVTSSDGAPLSGALVTLSGYGAEHSARTNAHGAFGISGVPGGTYNVRVDAKGFDPITGRTIDVATGGGALLNLAMARATTSLTTIGQVRVSGQQTVSTSSAPTVDVNSQAYADIGYTRVSDMLDNEISTTLIHPLAGSPSLPTSVALRGPDPTETLVDVDGHSVNNGNTGDFDLSLLDPADYSSVQLVYGISPSSLVGPNTIDGAINIRTLEPSTDPHGVFRLSTGSWGAFGATLDATGTSDKVGYAFSLHRVTTNGEVNENVVDATSGQQQSVGSAVDGTTALGKLRYAFGNGSGFVGLTFHDQSFYKDLSAGLTSVPPPGGTSSSSSAVADLSPQTSNGLPIVDSFAGTYEQAHNSAYGLDFQVPLGRLDSSGIAKTTALLRWQTSLVSQSVFGPGADTNPYLYNSRDAVGDGILEVDQRLPKGLLTLQLDLHNEQLTTDYVPGVVNDQSIARRPFASNLVDQATSSYLVDPAVSSGPTPAPGSTPAAIPLGQTQRSAVLRYSVDPTSKLHYTLAAYYSNFTSFGTSFDPRVGFVWTPNADSAVRASVGSTFQAPQLPELYVPPVLPPPVGGYISIGNPNLQPDHATDFDLGYEHFFGKGGSRTHVSVDTYRTNLRTPATTLVPPLSNNGECNSSSGGDAILRNVRAAATPPPCPLSYPVNAGNAIYQGVEIRADRQVAQYTTVRAGYSINSAYLTAVPPNVQDGTLVVGEQALGLPLQKGVLSIDRRPPNGLEYGASFVYQGLYNGYDQGQFATVNAMLGYRFKKFEVNLAATNLTNVYDYKFTYQNAGLPYGGCCGTGPIPTDAYAMQGTNFTLTVSQRY